VCSAAERRCNEKGQLMLKGIKAGELVKKAGSAKAAELAKKAAKHKTVDKAF
jgi:hypothetical protein